jgi:5'-3' exoribonuclease 2
MGIPSYYKKLTDTVTGLLSKSHPNVPVDWFWMDFNCLIYHCLHKESMPLYDSSNKDEWENTLLDEVVKYTLKIIQLVDPKKGVQICIDGVVPMAKMRQQRLRRFKSAWMKTHSDTSQESWDTNSITPGTAFMGKLKNRLETISKKHGNKHIQISSSDSPGEGEHKIMEDWRSNKFNGNFAIYGLDADLIVLSLLGRELWGKANNVWLFREEITAGKVEYDSLGEEQFEWFSIHTLCDHLCKDISEEKRRAFILNYCFGMSILGNDFLPSSLGLKIRDNGYIEFVKIIHSLTENGHNLVSSNDINIYGVLMLFTTLAKDEAHSVYKYIHKKNMITKNLGIHTLKESDGFVQKILKKIYFYIITNFIITGKKNICHSLVGWNLIKNQLMQYVLVI